MPRRHEPQQRWRADPQRFTAVSALVKSLQRRSSRRDALIQPAMGWGKRQKLSPAQNPSQHVRPAQSTEITYVGFKVYTAKFGPRRPKSPPGEGLAIPRATESSGDRVQKARVAGVALRPIYIRETGTLSALRAHGERGAGVAGADLLEVRLIRLAVQKPINSSSDSRRGDVMSESRRHLMQSTRPSFRVSTRPAADDGGTACRRPGRR